MKYYTFAKVMTIVKCQNCLWQIAVYYIVYMCPSENVGTKAVYFTALVSATFEGIEIASNIDYVVSSYLPQTIQYLIGVSQLSNLK